jgi:nucleotide-binding universal stress UspA family protein
MAEAQSSAHDVASHEVETPPAPVGTGRILVGVDGSAGSAAALAWAIQEARLRGGAVHAVMAWQRPQSIGAANVWGMGMDPSLSNDSLLSSATADEAARLGAQAAQGQDVAVTSAAVEGHPAAVLLDSAADADLLVVGSRGHGGFVGSLLGSVSQHVVTHAPCPVVVVPDPQRAAHDGPSAGKASSYGVGVFGQAHEHGEGQQGQGIYEQGHSTVGGQGTYGQGHREAGEGVYEQGRSDPEDV